MLQRMTWDEICCREDCRGRWVALTSCRYDAQGQAAEGEIVDVDDDLAELCLRVREQHRTHCDIKFCTTPSQPS